jgi:hypothetical protein
MSVYRMHANNRQHNETKRAPQAGPVVLVSPDAGLQHLLDRALAESNEALPAASRLCSVAEKISPEELRSCAAAIIDCRREGSIADIRWRTLLRNRASLPCILIVPNGDRAAGLRAIMDGAQDFIEAGELSEQRLRRAIECAIERLRVKTAIDQRHRTGSVLGDAGSSITAGLYGLGALEQTLPGDHRFLVAEYGGVLQRMLDGYGTTEVPAAAKERLVELVERIGALRGTPRDLVNIHTQALQRILQDASEQQENAISAEARFVLLEALGYLAYYFRRYSVQLPF